jgi:hypothetical protein
MMDGSWQRISYEESRKHLNLFGTEQLILRAVKEHIKSTRTCLMCAGGFENQPKKFWEMVDLSDMIDIAFFEQDEKLRKKDGKRTRS